MSKKHDVISTNNQKSWIERYPKIWAILLLIAGFILGFLGNIVYGSWQTQQEDVSTAQSLYNELNSSTNMAAYMAPQYENGSISIPNNPFYPQSSVLPVVKTKMGRFDSTLAHNISEYDTSLSIAEQDRLKMIDVDKISSNVTLSVYDKSLQDNSVHIFKEMANCVSYCNYLTPIIEKELHDEFGVS
jgi:hypothetical protein